MNVTRVISTAGRGIDAPPESGRREAIQRIRAIVRRVESTDAEVEDALDALVELARTPEE